MSFKEKARWWKLKYPLYRREGSGDVDNFREIVNYF
jgi:hypothetical protein